MIEKGIAVAFGIFGLLFGIDMAAAVCKDGDPKILTLGKEAAGGLICGLGAYKGATELIPMIPFDIQKGDNA